jgi:hypothetical protein
MPMGSFGGEMENIIGAGLGDSITYGKCIFDITFKKVI